MSLAEAIQAFRVQLPVIDPDNNETLPGLRFLRDEANKDDELPHLVAVWNELVHARQPVAIYRTFSDKARGVKVDVVAENGARWVRVNTIKNTRLMMEFCEIDSYLTGDDEDGSRARLAQTELDNSMLRMGRELLAAAKANPIPISTPSSTTIIPQVTIRLTRLDPLKDDTPDRRIERTIQSLRDMGVDVQLGERPHSRAPIPKTPLEPTTNINLDLSALIALISDISHSPLPRTEQEAHARFEPPQTCIDWKKDRVKSLARQNHRSPYNVVDDECTWESSGQHSRVLAAQAIQEMNKGILHEIHERLSAVVTNATFWTTSEARDRCLQIVSKIGGERERVRADTLLGSTLCTRTPPIPAPVVTRTGEKDDTKTKTLADAYWEHSRYLAGFLPLVPVYVYPSILPETQDDSRKSTATFFDALARTCTEILSQGAVSRVSVRTMEEVVEGIPPPAQTPLPKLTVHTVTSMLAGASRGHTTLTTNRSSVKVVLKEMRKMGGSSGYGHEPVGEVEKAGLWILDPRSLSEGMRCR